MRKPSEDRRRWVTYNVPTKADKEALLAKQPDLRRVTQWYMLSAIERERQHEAEKQQRAAECRSMGAA